MMVIKNTTRHTRKTPAISKALRLSGAPSSRAFVSSGTKEGGQGKSAPWRRCLSLHPGEDRRSSREKRREGGCCPSLASHRGPGCPLSKLGSWQQALEITKCWQHRFDMNMQIRIFKSPTSCFWIFLKIQPLTVTNRKERRKRK